VALLMPGCTGGDDDSQATTAGSDSKSEQPPAPDAAAPAPPGAVSAAGGESTGAIAVGVQLPGAQLQMPAWAGKLADEPFPVKEFFDSRTPPQDNAQALCLHGLAELSSDLVVLYPPEERQARHDRVRPLEQQIGQLADADKLLAGTVPVDTVRQVLTQARPGLEMLEEAQRSGPCLFVTGLEINSLLPHAQAVRTVARLATLELYEARHSGDFEAVERSPTRTLRLSRDLRPRGPAISQLVSMAVDATVLSAIRQQVLPRSDLTAPQCERLLAVLTQHEQQGLDPFQEAIRTEYIILGNTLTGLESGRISPADVELDQIPPRLINYEAEWEAANRLFALILASAERPYHEMVGSDPVASELQQLRAQAGSLANSLRNQQVFQSAVVIPILLPGLVQVREADARSRARLGGVQALTAVQRYRRVHGQWPDTLDAAIQDAGLSAIPLDPYSGRPLRYRVLDGHPLVYSVGSDQQDDGGEVDWKYGQQPGDFVFRIGA
ncbi:MAG: hypothetical protein KY476_25325, partial [Planctomycetes bacterium]|nr:hypothetical protein [Planctomycetota bacterium]